MFSVAIGDRRSVQLLDPEPFSLIADGFEPNRSQLTQLLEFSLSTTASTPPADTTICCRSSADLERMDEHDLVG